MKLKPKSTVKNPKALVYRRFTEIDISRTQYVVYVTVDNKYWIFDTKTESFKETSYSENAITVTVTTLLKYLNKYYRYEYLDSFYGYNWIEGNENYVPYKYKTYYSANSAPIDHPLANYNITVTIMDDTKPSYEITAFFVEDHKIYKFSGTVEPLFPKTFECVYEGETDSSNRFFQWQITASPTTLNSPTTFIWNEKPVDTLGVKFNKVSKYQTNKYYYSGCFDYVIKGSIEGTTAQYIKGNVIPLTALNIKYFNDSIDLKPDDLVVIGEHLYSVENPETVLKQQPKAYKVYFATLNNIL